MKVIELKSIPSTQDYLKNILESQPNEQYLVICQEQTSGKGRHGNEWEHIPGSLACSFNIAAHSILTLSSLEVGVLVAEYFSKFCHTTLQLKWPNDIFYENKKCGGILTHIHQDSLIVGLGINAFDSSLDKTNWRTGIDLKDSVGIELIEFIHSNRITDPQELKRLWLSYCLHLNRDVQIDQTQGKFIGLGDQGQALIQTQDTIEQKISGSLRFIF